MWLHFLFRVLIISQSILELDSRQQFPIPFRRDITNYIPIFYSVLVISTIFFWKMNTRVHFSLEKIYFVWICCRIQLYAFQILKICETTLNEMKKPYNMLFLLLVPCKYISGDRIKCERWISRQKIHRKHVPDFLE